MVSGPAKKQKAVEEFWLNADKKADID